MLHCASSVQAAPFLSTRLSDRPSPATIIRSERGAGVNTPSAARISAPRPTAAVEPISPNFDPRPYQWNQYADHSYRWQPYQPPRGWYDRRWSECSEYCVKCPSAMRRSSATISAAGNCKITRYDDASTPLRATSDEAYRMVARGSFGCK